MTIDPVLEDALVAVAGVLRDASDPWWVVGSAAAALHGAAPIAVADVDILLSEADARAILPMLGLSLDPGTASPRFRSAIFATWSAAPMPVEFMAGFRLREQGRWVAIAPATRETVRVRGAAIPIPARDELKRLLWRFGRAKDLTRALAL